MDMTDMQLDKILQMVDMILDGCKDLDEAKRKIKKLKDGMDEMSAGELLKETTEENQTRKILEILNESKDLEEAKEKVKALLEK